MKRLRYLIIVLISLILLVPLLIGQIPRSQVVFAYLGLSNSPQSINYLKEADIQLLDNRVKGSLLEIARSQNYSITTPKNSLAIIEAIKNAQPQRFKEELIGFGNALTASGVLLCELDINTGGFVFIATLFSSPGAEVVTRLTVGAPTIDTLYDRASALMYEVFGLPSPNAEIVQNIQIGPSVGSFGRDRDIQIPDISGTWYGGQGDYGIDKIDINADGSAFAWLTDSTDTMKLRVSISGQTVIVTQDEPNSPKLYVPIFPYTIAAQIVRLARPMSWEFKLTIEKDRLVGKKETSYFFIEQGKIMQVDNTYSRDAVWTRTP